MLVLDSTVLLAAMDQARIAHQSARTLISSKVRKAVTTQTMREAIAVATRPLGANGLGLEFGLAWRSIMAMRMACDSLLYETEKWWASYEMLAQEIKPAGRSVYDLGQVAHVHCLGKSAKLMTDDDGLCMRYKDYIDVITVTDYHAKNVKPKG